MQSLDLITLLRFFLRIRLNFMQKLSKSAVHKDLRAYEIQPCEQFLQAILQKGMIPVMNSRPQEIKEWTTVQFRSIRHPSVTVTRLTKFSFRHLTLGAA
jgi:hypothetical protein